MVLESVRDETISRREDSPRSAGPAAGKTPRSASFDSRARFSSVRDFRELTRTLSRRVGKVTGIPDKSSKEYTKQKERQKETMLRMRVN